MVGIFSSWYIGILLAQGAVLDKMAVTATLETSLLFDHIDVTIEYGFGFRIYTKVQCCNFLFLILMDGIAKYLFRFFN